MQFPNAPLKHIINYVKGKIEEKQEEKIYRVYVTDMLKVITGASVRYYDLISEDEKKVHKTSEQIKSEIFDVFKKLGGEK